VLPVAAGSVIAGKYRVESLVASGGMGVVARGLHQELEQTVAIKFLRPDVAINPEAAERFLREARSSARLRSDHVVRVFDVGKHEETTPYMVMEYLEGSDFSDELAGRGALPVTEAVDYVVQALDAVAEAHALGIVHRDLKPSNLFLASRGSGARRVKVLDFGISKQAMEGVDRSLTDTSMILGSPGYMSPEQVRSTKGVDARSDVWSMAVILYEALSGEPAFPGDSLGEIFSKIREEPLPSIRSKRPDVPPELDAVLARCLQRNRELRPRDAREMLVLLAPFAGRAVATDVVSEPKLPPARISHPDPETMGIEQMSTAPTIDVRGLARSEGVAAGSLAAETQRAWGGRTGQKKGVARGVLVGAGLLVVVSAALTYGLTRTEPEPEPSSRPTSPPAAFSPAPAPTFAPMPAPSAEPAPAASASSAPPPRVAAPQHAVKSRPARPKEKAPPKSAPVPRPTDDLGI
jgi:serine/threonine-protein kinase